MNKILITGASGFIGQHLLKKLEMKGLDCFTIDSTNIVNLGKSQQNIVSLLNKNELNTVIKENTPSVVIHLAAIASVTHNDIGEIYNVNVCGTDNLLSSIQKYCPKDTRIILMSTAGVYGNQEVEKYNEDLSYNPINHYSYSKMVTEYLSNQYKSDLEIIIVRPFNIIGLGQKSTFLIPKLVKAFATREKKIQVGNLKSYRDYVDVEYCTEILTELTIRPTIPFKLLNICSGIPSSGEMVIDSLKKLTGYIPEIEINDKFIRKNEVWKMVGDPKRLHSFMNGKKSKSLYEVLEQMVKYYENS